MVARFTATWLWLDRSMLKHIWPYLLGAALAAGAIIVTHSVVISAVIAFVVFGILYFLGRRASAYEEAMRKTSD